MAGNEETLTKGFARGKAYMADVCEELLRRFSREILSESYNEMLAERKWRGFTGNAQNSMAGILYKNGAISDIVFPLAMGRPPIHEKIPRGESLFLSYPYEGYSRKATGRAELETTSAAGAIAEVAMFPFKSTRKTIGAMRLTMAVEYNEWLKMSDYADPYTMLRQTATLALQGLKGI